MSKKVKIENEKISMRKKAELTIIHASIKRMNEDNLWKLYGVLCNAKNDIYRPLIFKMLDNEMNKRNIIHDFSEYIK